MGETERAQGALETILRHNLYHVPAMVRLGHLLHNQQQYLQAAELYQKAINIMETSPGSNIGGPVALANAWAALAHCYLLLDDLPKAFNAYQQALGCPSVTRDPTLWFGIGLLYDRYGADEHALEAFSAVLKLDPHVQAVCHRAQSVSSSLSSSFVPSPMLREVYYRIGMLLRNRKRYEAAMECFKYVAQFPPVPLQIADVRLQQAFTKDLMGDLEGARQILESPLIREGRKALASRGMTLLGWVLVRLHPEASSDDPGLALLKQAVQEDPANALASYFLGRAYFCRQLLAQSYEAYQEAVYRDGQNVAFWNSIGILYLETRQYRDALDAFSRAIHLSASVAEVWWNLGILYEASNNQLSDAIDAYQRAAELSPQDSQVTEHLAFLKNSSATTSDTSPSTSTSTSGTASSAVSLSSSSSLLPSPSLPRQMKVREVDPLPFMMRPILLGMANIPMQKAPPPTSNLVSPTGSLNSPHGSRMNLTAPTRPRPHPPTSSSVPLGPGGPGIPLGGSSNGAYHRGSSSARPMMPPMPHMTATSTSYVRNPDTVTRSNY